MSEPTGWAGDGTRELGGGGVDCQTGGAPIPNIGDTSAADVAEDIGPVLVDGEPVSPYLAARRYGAAAGQGYRGLNPDAGSP
jgi:hypothetical protein